MSLIELIILAIALGIDCLVVSFSQGLLINNNRIKTSLILALIMGMFQGCMPIISYSLTSIIYNYISPFAKSLVFGIFLFLGTKFILEAINQENNNLQTKLNYKIMLILGIATSIDALGAGISLKLTNSSLLISSLIIGFLSFIMSKIGFWGGAHIKQSHTKTMSICAGLILICLAIKTLL